MPLQSLLLFLVTDPSPAFATWPVSDVKAIASANPNSNGISLARISLGGLAGSNDTRSLRRRRRASPYISFVTGKKFVRPGGGGSLAAGEASYRGVGGSYGSSFLAEREKRKESLQPLRHLAVQMRKLPGDLWGGRWRGEAFLPGSATSWRGAW